MRHKLQSILQTKLNPVGHIWKGICSSWSCWSPDMSGHHHAHGWCRLLSSLPLPALPQESIQQGPSQTNTGVWFEKKSFKFLARWRCKRGNSWFLLPSQTTLKPPLTSADPSPFAQRHQPCWERDCATQFKINWDTELGVVSRFVEM